MLYIFEVNFGCFSNITIINNANLLDCRAPNEDPEYVIIMYHVG